MSENPERTMNKDAGGRCGKGRHSAGAIAPGERTRATGAWWPPSGVRLLASSRTSSTWRSAYVRASRAATGFYGWRGGRDWAGAGAAIRRGLCWRVPVDPGILACYLWLGTSVSYTRDRHACLTLYPLDFQNAGALAFPPALAFKELHRDAAQNALRTRPRASLRSARRAATLTRSRAAGRAAPLNAHRLKLQTRRVRQTKNKHGAPPANGLSGWRADVVGRRTR